MHTLCSSFGKRPISASVVPVVAPDPRFFWHSAPPNGETAIEERTVFASRTQQTCKSSSAMSALGGKADIDWKCADAQSGQYWHAQADRRPLPHQLQVAWPLEPRAKASVVANLCVLILRLLPCCGVPMFDMMRGVTSIQPNTILDVPAISEIAAIIQAKLRQDCARVVHDFWRTIVSVL